MVTAFASLLSACSWILLGHFDYCQRLHVGSDSSSSCYETPSNFLESYLTISRDFLEISASAPAPWPGRFCHVLQLRSACQLRLHTSPQFVFGLTFQCNTSFLTRKFRHISWKLSSVSMIHRWIFANAAPLLFFTSPATEVVLLRLGLHVFIELSKQLARGVHTMGIF
jgi:hypothetical protein